LNQSYEGRKSVQRDWEFEKKIDVLGRQLFRSSAVADNLVGDEMALSRDERLSSTSDGSTANMERTLPVRG